jgi:hypothetical protein
LAYLFGGAIQLGAVALTPVCVDAESVTGCAGEHMQVNVEAS